MLAGNDAGRIETLVDYWRKVNAPTFSFDSGYKSGCSERLQCLIARMLSLLCPSIG